MRICFISERSSRYQPQHAIAEINSNFHEARPTDRVEPKRFSDLIFDLSGEGSG